jgi:hypothetical protein
VDGVRWEDLDRSSINVSNTESLQKLLRMWSGPVNKKSEISDERDNKL